MNNMTKIGKKILTSYFLILLVAFLIISISFNYLSSFYLINETRDQLIKEGEEISKAISTDTFGNPRWSDNLINRQKFTVAGSFIESTIVVLNEHDQIIYKDLKDIDDNQLLDIMQNETKIDGYVYEIILIVDDTGNNIGKIILLCEIKSFDELNALMRKTEIISFIIAGIIALIIGLFFEKRLANPIGKLKEKMNKFSIDKENDFVPITTGDEIEELDISFRKMADKVKNYNEKQKNFFQNVSHELKTPLMSIQGYAEAIKDEVVKGEEVKESLDIIINESQRLKKTVNSVIYLTKLENFEENYNLKNVKLFKIVNSSIKMLKPLADSKGINIENNVKQDIFVNVDDEKFMNALTNIISNAIRYAESYVSITCYDEKNNLELLIKDDGSGFKQGEEDKVFDRFYKGVNGNTGIGLALAKVIVKGHGGKIKALNNVPNGAIIKIEIPRN